MTLGLNSHSVPFTIVPALNLLFILVSRSPSHQLLIALPNRPRGKRVVRSKQNPVGSQSPLLSAIFQSDFASKGGASNPSLVRRIVIGPNALVVGSFTGKALEQSRLQRRMKRVKKCHSQEVKTRRCRVLLKRQASLEGKH